MYKVIIVDDEKLLRQGFIHMTDWAKIGIEIVGDVANGIEALNLIEQARPDIVVTDVRMPGMDGIELTRIIKDKYPGVEVIVLSSFNEFEYVKESLQLGALDYILKPKMQYTDLLAALEKAKERKQGVIGQQPFEDFLKAALLEPNAPEEFAAFTGEKNFGTISAAFCE